MPVRATAAGGPERTRMAGVYYALDRDNLLGCVTHLCPLGPVAYGSGPTGVRRGTLDKAWLERVEGACIRQAGPWAKIMSLGTLIPITRVIGMNGIFSDHVSDPFLGRRLIVIETRFPRNGSHHYNCKQSQTRNTHREYDPSSDP